MCVVNVRNQSLYKLNGARQENWAIKYGNGQREGAMYVAGWSGAVENMGALQQCASANDGCDVVDCGRLVNDTLECGQTPVLLLEGTPYKVHLYLVIS